MLCGCDSTFVQKIITNVDKNLPFLFAVEYFTAVIHRLANNILYLNFRKTHKDESLGHC